MCLPKKKSTDSRKYLATLSNLGRENSIFTKTTTRTIGKIVCTLIAVINGLPRRVRIVTYESSLNVQFFRNVTIVWRTSEVYENTKLVCTLRFPGERVYIFALTLERLVGFSRRTNVRHLERVSFRRKTAGLVLFTYPAKPSLVSVLRL